MALLPKNDCINSEMNFTKRSYLSRSFMWSFTVMSRSALHSVMSEFTPAKDNSFGAPEMKALHAMDMVSWHTPICISSVLVGGHDDWLLATCANLQMQTVT